MTIKLDLPEELESELRAEANRLGLSLTEYALRLLAVGRHIEKTPINGAELVAYWEREGLIGSRSDVEDGPAHARALRKRVQAR